MGKAVFFKLQQIQSKRFQLENLRFVFFWGGGVFFLIITRKLMLIVWLITVYLMDGF